MQSMQTEIPLWFIHNTRVVCVSCGFKRIRKNINILIREGRGYNNQWRHRQSLMMLGDLVCAHSHSTRKYFPSAIIFRLLMLLLHSHMETMRESTRIHNNVWERENWQKKKVHKPQTTVLTKKKSFIFIYRMTNLKCNLHLKTIGQIKNLVFNQKRFFALIGTKLCFT